MKLYGLPASYYVILLLFGAISALLVRLFDKRPNGGVFTTILLGMLGALSGGLLAVSLLQAPLLNATIILSAFFGGIILSVIARIFLKHSRVGGRIRTKKTLA